MKTKRLLLSLLALCVYHNIYASFTYGDWEIEIIDESAHTARIISYDGGVFNGGTIITPQFVTNPSTGTTYSITEIGKYHYAGSYYYTVFSGYTDDEYQDPFYGKENWTIVISEGVETINEYAFNVLFNGTIYLPSSLNTVYTPILNGGGNMVFCVPPGFSLNLNLGNDVTIITESSPYISFADAKTKEICVSNWDTNMDGELSYSEASAITSLNDVFKNNTEITSFNELQYFTGLSNLKDAFYKCTSLVTVKLPNSLIATGERAFSGCTSLSQIVLPTNLQRLSWYTFNGCSNMVSITIPRSVNTIENGVFFSSGLTSVIIPDGVKYIEESAFQDCKNLANITLNSGLIAIGKSAFAGCEKLKKIIIPENINTIHESVFANCSELTEVSFLNSLNKIPNGSFSGCVSLEKIDFPKNITTIGAQSFKGCTSLSSLTIPEGITLIGGGAFSDCSQLNTVYILEATPPDCYDGCFSGVNATLYVPAGCKAAYEAADYWKEFGTIVEMEPPSPVITFADANVKAICVANWDANGDGELSEEEAAAVTSLDDVFENNSQITSFDELVYFTGLTSIGYSAFCGCSNLTSLKIPNGVENIYEKTLSGCSSLQSLSISGSVRYIYAKSFDDCINLKELRLEDGTSNLNLNYSWRDALGVGGHAFYRCPLESVYLGRGLIYDSDREYGYSPFYNKTNLTNVTIGNNVTIISSNLFRSCTGLTSITIPDNVKTIGESAFYGCSSLNNLQWSEGLEKIMKDAFSDCSNLPSVTFPNTLTTIGDRAFIGCNAFTSIFIPANVTSIGFAAFARCPNIISMVVTDENSFYDSRYSCNAIIETATNKLIAGCQNTVIPQTVETIYDRAFLGCTSLTTIVIPESVTSIGSYAFQDCTGLTSVKVKIATPLSIDSNTFANQANATLYVPQGRKSAYEAANYWKEFKEIKEFIRDGSYSYIASNGLRWNFKLHDEKATLCGYYDDSDGTVSCCVTGNLPSTLVIPSIVKVAGSDVGLPVVGIDDWAFCETSSDDSDTYFDNVTSIFIPSGIKYISGNAFVYYYSRNLTKVEFASIESFLNIRFGEYSNPLFIAHHLYINGSEVKNLVIPNSITSINEYAFQGCYGMTSVTIPNSVTSIGSYAFEECSSLTSVKVDIASPLPINSSTFPNRTNSTLIVPVGSKAAYQAANYWKDFKRIIEFIEGDVNGDGETDVLDVVDIARYVVGTPAETFVSSLADMNSDGQVNIGDAVTLVNEIAGDQNFVKPMMAPRKITADEESLSLTEGNSGLSLALENQRSYTAFQFDLYLPEGVDVTTMMLNAQRKQKHQLLYNKVESGHWRVTAFSTSNRSFQGHDGELLSFALDIEGDIALRNIQFFDAEGNGYQFDDICQSGVTGVKAIDHSPLTIDHSNIYDIQGRRHTKLQRGLNIVNGKKVFVK